MRQARRPRYLHESGRQFNEVGFEARQQFGFGRRVARRFGMQSCFQFHT